MSNIQSQNYAENDAISESSPKFEGLYWRGTDEILRLHNQELNMDKYSAREAVSRVDI